MRTIKSIFLTLAAIATCTLPCCPVIGLTATGPTPGCQPSHRTYPEGGK